MTENIDIQWNALLSTLREMGEAIRSEIVKNLAADNSNASRTLTNSIDYEYGVDDGRYWIDITMEDYWKDVNDGQKPGKMPSVEKIKEWIIIKPIKPSLPSVKSLAFWIRGSIKKRKGFAPPVSALEKWINNKGLQRKLAENYPSVDSLAWAIAKKIEKKGTKGTNFLDRAVEAVEKSYDEKVSNAVQEDIHYWIEEQMADFISTFEP